MYVRRAETVMSSEGPYVVVKRYAIEAKMKFVLGERFNRGMQKGS